MSTNRRAFWGTHFFFLSLFFCSSLSVYAETFSRNLTIGDSGSDVLQLQILLNQNLETRVADSGAGSPGYETTYFGARTADAVRRFQELNRQSILIPRGLSAGTGFFGSLTRAFIQESNSGDTSKKSTVSEGVLKPVIFSINPKSGRVGTKITIYGEGFLPEGNTVSSLLEEFENVPSEDGTTLEVVVEGPFPAEFLKKYKDFYKEHSPQMEYLLVIRNASGTSNFVPFIFNFY